MEYRLECVDERQIPYAALPADSGRYASMVGQRGEVGCGAIDQHSELDADGGDDLGMSAVSGANACEGMADAEVAALGQLPVQDDSGSVGASGGVR